MERKIEDLNAHVINLSKERDLIRNQYESMKMHLEQETKRAINLEAQLIKNQGELEQERREGNSSRSQNPHPNVGYLLARIKALEDALMAVGDELSDAKNSGVNLEVAESSIVTKAAENCDLQRSAEEWAKKEQLYLKEM